MNGQNPFDKYCLNHDRLDRAHQDVHKDRHFLSDQGLSCCAIPSLAWLWGNAPLGLWRFVM